MNRWLAAALALLCWPTVTFAQTPDTATVIVRVQDASGAALAGAQVHIGNRRDGIVNDRGELIVSGLDGAVSYIISASSEGFLTGSTDLRLAGGSTARVVLTLAVSGGVSRVTVEGAATDVRTDEPQMGLRLSAEQAEATPLLNRRITALPLLQAANRPAINQGDVFMNQQLFTTNGAGRRQTWFEVDGISGNDSWGRQTIFTNVPLDAVAEMSVLTNAFAPEYGAGTGSVVNIITRSGGDRLHGDALDLWRPATPEAKLSGFTAGNATSGNQISSDTLAQTAASLGGRMLSDATHFFVSGELSQQNRASPITSTLAPGSFIGHYRDLLAFFRLDHNFSGRHSGFLRESDDGFYDTNPNGIVGGATLATVARTFRRRTYTTELGDTFMLGSRLLNTVRAQFQLASPITEFDPVVYGTQFVVPLSGVAGATSFTTGTSQSALLMNRQYGIAEVLSAAIGRHQLTMGGDWTFAHTGGNSKEFGGPIYLGKFTYNTCSQGVTICESAAYLNNIANVANYTQSYGNANYTVNDNLFGVFVQDDWRVTRRVTLNLGSRYEGQTFTDSRLGFAPRVGVDWDPRGTGETVVRAGFGIYRSQIVDNEEASYALTGPTGVFNYTASPGQVGFPTSVAAAPLPAFPASATPPLRSLYLRPGLSSYYDQFLPTETLVGYPSRLLNPYSEQYTASLEQRLAAGTVVALDYVGTHTLRIVRPLDVDAPSTFIRTTNSAVRSAIATNCSRPYWIATFAKSGVTCLTSSAAQQPAYSVIQSDVNDGTLHYNALDATLHKNWSNRALVLLSYTWSHTLDNVDPDATSQNPNDPNQPGRAEYGNALYDQRSRLVLSGFVTLPLKVRLGGITTLATGLPYNLTTGLTNSGDTGATTDRPLVNGVLVGRDTGRGTPIYQFDPFIEREFPVFEHLHIGLRAEAFNALNHANFVTFNSVYGTALLPSATLGVPSTGVTAQLPARQLQFAAHIRF